MPHHSSGLLLMLFALLLSGTAPAAPPNPAAPWGRATSQSVDYTPQKVVYDVAVQSEEAFSRVLDRASYLNNVYAADPFSASIVLVLHGKEMLFFAISNYDRYKELMTRAQSLTVGGTIEIRMCETAARGYGLTPPELHGFVQMVPMADAEIVRLQQESGYAYMQ
ncbi:MAG: DsrE family protein [Thiogranum sp.]|nr:DsrE family protein [Thiogranum sp.]